MMLVQRLLFSQISRRIALCCNYSVTDSYLFEQLKLVEDNLKFLLDIRDPILGIAASKSTIEKRLVPLSSLKRDELGHCILLCKETMPPGSSRTPHDMVSTTVFITKILSLSSSVAGVVMVPILSAYLWDAAAERPAMMMFTIIANTFLLLLSFTPLLLHFLVKRFPVNIYYNHDTKTFTSVHYNFFLRKMARQFKASEVVDAQVAPEMNKVWIPLATAFVHSKPLLISLDRNAYIDKLAFDEMTKNIRIPANHD